MALSVRDCDEMVKVEQETPGIYQIGTQLRYGSPFQPAIRAILDGEIGTPILIRAHRHNIGDYPRIRDWFFKRSMSGDTICEQAVHEFDFFCWIFGGPAQRAAGFGGLALHTDVPRDTRDYYTMVFDYGQDKQVSYNHSWISSPKTYCDGRQEVVYGTKGAVDIENGMIFPREGEPRKVSPEPKGDTTQLAVNDFFRCIREGEKPLADAQAGRNSALTALLGLKALDTGRVVTLEEILRDGMTA
jgi:predicted dehydrogenase